MCVRYFLMAGHVCHTRMMDTGSSDPRPCHTYSHGRVKCIPIELSESHSTPRPQSLPHILLRQSYMFWNHSRQSCYRRFVSVFSRCRWMKTLLLDQLGDGIWVTHDAGSPSPTAAVSGMCCEALRHILNSSDGAQRLICNVLLTKSCGYRQAARRFEIAVADSHTHVNLLASERPARNSCHMYFIPVLLYPAALQKLKQPKIQLLAAETLITCRET